MNFTTLTPLAFGLGLAALAGLLFLLQRLRVRHRDVEVVTTLFWREAVEETRARVLTKRFRHPWAFALLLAIAALIWAAIAEPKLNAIEATTRIALLDNSAGMARGDRFERAKEDLLAWAQGTPAEGRHVLVTGATQRALLLPGEEFHLLEQRLQGIEPEAAPSSIPSQLLHLASTIDDQAEVYLFGGDGLDEEFAGLIPDRLAIVQVGEALAESSNSGICALGVAPAASGDWTRVDVYVEVRGEAGSQTPALSTALAGSPIELQAETTPSTAGIHQFHFRDLPARGEEFQISLAGTDDLPLDDRASLRLPERRPLRVALDEELSPILAAVLEHDPAVILGQEQPDLRIVADARSTSVPTLRFVASDLQQESFLVTYDDSRSPQAVLSSVLGSLGLDAIDSAGLASEARVPITFGVLEGPQREIGVWSELIGPNFAFRDSRSFPLFLARSLRWLARVESITPWVAAGEPLVQPESTGISTLQLAALPRRAAETVARGDQSFKASLLAPTSSMKSTAMPTPLQELELAKRGLDLAHWLLLIALLLFGWEWVLVRTERIP